MFPSLFTASTEPSLESHVRSKSQCSCCTTEREDVFTRNKKQTDLEAVRRASLIVEKTRQMRDQE